MAFNKDIPHLWQEESRGFHMQFINFLNLIKLMLPLYRFVVLFHILFFCWCFLRVLYSGVDFFQIWIMLGGIFPKQGMLHMDYHSFVHLTHRAFNLFARHLSERFLQGFWFFSLHWEYLNLTSSVYLEKNLY